MLDKLVRALNKRSELNAWSVRHIVTSGTQQYDLQETVEAVRSITNERYVVNVLRETQGVEGEATCGAGSVTVLPGDDIEDGLNSASLMAGLLHNQPYSLPAPADVPDVELSDHDFRGDPANTLASIASSVKDAVRNFSDVRLAALETFGEEKTTHLVNSRGVDATQEETNYYLEWVFLSGNGDEEVESFAQIHRRRAVDLELTAEVARYAQFVTDLLVATPSPNYHGPVVIRGATLAEVVNSESNILKLLSSASFKYSKETPWEIGESVFRSEVKGDPLNVWANRMLHFGTDSNRFDDDGLPAQRVELIRENKLVNFIASQRYADYLEIPVTGAFGDLELSAGVIAAEDLLSEPYVEVAAFSWFNPDPITGDFATEVRLGYMVEDGKRTPFKGGMLIGNLLDAFADVRWSAETGFYGNYLGPTTARFNDLMVGGEVS
jgi:predicted Zn-dependent protease